jgi:peptidylprolyl isomerase/FKBP-type peptidyl-prolyl cis-trans isomerase SlyD
MDKVKTNISGYKRLISLQQGSFARINYIEKVKITGRVTDTNIEAEARKAEIFDPERTTKYSPMPVIIGSGLPSRGIDEMLLQMELGETRDFEVPPEKAYGTRDPKLIDHASMTFFKKQGINPVRGLPIRTRRGIAIVRSAMGGRIRLDYNHPLAGQVMSYHVEVVEEAGDLETKLRWLIEMNLPRIDSESHIIEVEDGNAMIELNTADYRPEVVERLKEILVAQIKERLPEIQGVTFGPTEPIELEEQTPEDSESDSVREQVPDNPEDGEEEG